MTWQEGLERLLSPNTPAADRDVLLRDLLSRGPEIADEVTRAIGTGDLQSLAPPDGEGKRVLDDLEAVRRQVVDDLLPQATSEAQTLLSDPATVANEVQRAAQDAADAAPQTMTAVNTLLQDPARAAALVQQELGNAVSRTPEGVEMPAFRVMGRHEGFELRAYESFSVVSAPCEEASDIPLTPAAALRTTVTAYNSLNAYFFGVNANGEALEVTSPVRTETITELGRTRSEMSMMLPRSLSARVAPAPSDGRLTLRQTAAETVAVAKFSGLATEGEVRRCLSRLVGAVRSGGVRLADDSVSRYTLLQYNGPITLPWLRTNEVCIPVELLVDSQGDGVEASGGADQSVSGDPPQSQVVSPAEGDSINPNNPDGDATNPNQDRLLLDDDDDSAPSDMD